MSSTPGAAFVALAVELAEGPGQLTTSGFEPGSSTSVGDRPAFGIELAPGGAGAAPVAFAFDDETLINVSSGEQGGHFEGCFSSAEEAVAFMREIVEAVVAGRYRERASASRLSVPRVDLEFLRGDGSMGVRVRYIDVTRDEPFEDRDYLPYR